MSTHPLDRVYGFIGRFVSYPSPEAQVAHALWIGHAHLMWLWDSTPRLAFLSPEPGSGKSRALEVTEPLVPRPVETVNATPAYLFRKVSDPAGSPTLLYDEIDTVFGPKARDNEDIRGMLNAGHRKGAMAGRCVMKGKVVETEELPAYCAVALAGLGNLPDTIITRSVVIHMRRRAPNEAVEPFRARIQRAEAAPIHNDLADWAATITHIDFPEMPDGIADRDADVWEALIAVADLAGGAWPAKARVAAIAMVSAAKERAPSLGIRLLSDLRATFRDAGQMTTSAILEALNGMEDAIWGDMKGKALDSRGLSRLMAPYGVKPTTLRTGTSTAKGYKQEDLHDVWQRYLPPTSQTAVTDGTNEPTTTDAVPYVTVVTDAEGMNEARVEATCARCQDVGCQWCEKVDADRGNHVGPRGWTYPGLTQ